MRSVFVGSNNLIKLESVKGAFERVWPEENWLICGHSVSSGVSEQPLDENETITGAANRAQATRGQTDAEYCVGIEGGLFHVSGRWMERGWVVVVNREGIIGYGSTAGLEVPEAFYHEMDQGATLTDVCAKHFGLENAGEDIGYYGLMTNNAVTRLSAYIEGVATALARFAQADKFEPVS